MVLAGGPSKLLIRWSTVRFRHAPYPRLSNFPKPTLAGGERNRWLSTARCDDTGLCQEPSRTNLFQDALYLAVRKKPAQGNGIEVRRPYAGGPGCPASALSLPWDRFSSPPCGRSGSSRRAHRAAHVPWTLHSDRARLPGRGAVRDLPRDSRAIVASIDCAGLFRKI